MNHITEMRERIMSWLRRRRERARLIEEAADGLISGLGPDAYDAARTMERRADNDKERRYWRDLARAIARTTGK